MLCGNECGGYLSYAVYRRQMGVRRAVDAAQASLWRCLSLVIIYADDLFVAPCHFPQRHLVTAVSAICRWCGSLYIRVFVLATLLSVQVKLAIL